jgi:flagellar biosynthetic protein FliR
VTLVELTLNEYLIFALVLLRMSGLVVFAPFFGGENFPQRARIGLAVFLSVLVFPSAGETLHGMGLPLNLVELGVLGIREIFVGVVIGYGAGLLFTGTQLAGELIGQQIGFALANVVDPITEQEVGLISFFKFSLTLILFLGLNLHLFMVQVLSYSYEAVGLGQSILRSELALALIELFGRIYQVGVISGGPVLLVMLMVSVTIGFLVRTMPQLNIMVVGLPLRTMVGLLTLMVAIRPFCHTVTYLADRFMRDVAGLVHLLSVDGRPVL